MIISAKTTGTMAPSTGTIVLPFTSWIDARIDKRGQEEGHHYKQIEQPHVHGRSNGDGDQGGVGVSRGFVEVGDVCLK